MNKEDFLSRQSLEGINDYLVEHVQADIVANANESNYPMPEAVQQKIAALTDSFPFNRYPPVKAENLSDVIADELNIPHDNVRIGNGASDLLQKVCYAFGGSGKSIAFPYPSFSMYSTYVQVSDSVAAPYPLQPDGSICAEEVIKFCSEKQPSLLIICNPNNPTGTYNALAEIEKIIAAAACPVVVDEAYMEFAGGKEVDRFDLRPLNKIWLVAGSVLTFNNKYSNLICIRTFSKAYGLAGLRCGYAVGCSSLMRILGKTMMPYSVSSYTLMVAKIVYEHKEQYRNIIKTIIAERSRLTEFLRENRFTVWNSSANFILFKASEEMSALLAESYDEVYGKDYQLSTTEKSGRFIYRYLLQNSILTADFSAEPHLSGCIRLTVALPQENDVIINKLKLLCEGLHYDKAQE